MQILKLTFLGLYLISCGNEAASFRGGNSSPTSLSNDAKARVLNNNSEDGPNENGEFSEAFYVGEFSKSKPVDIVLAMDTSLSMRQERQALEQNIESFLEDITNQTCFEKCELVIIDGASPGNELEVISKYQKQ